MLTLVSPADAHFNGKLKVTGDNGVVSIAKADGNNLEGYCDETVIAGAESPAEGGGVIVEVGTLGLHPPVGCTSFARLDEGTYFVFVYNGTAYNFNFPAGQEKLHDCLGTRAAQPGWFQIGTVQVDGTGHGSTGRLPLPDLDPNIGAGLHSAICITNLLPGPFDENDPLFSDYNMDLGNQVPLRLT